MYYSMVFEVQCSAVQCSEVKCRAAQCTTVQCSVVQWYSYTVQCTDRIIPDQAPAIPQPRKVNLGLCAAQRLAVKQCSGAE